MSSLPFGGRWVKLALVHDLAALPPLSRLKLVYPTLFEMMLMIGCTT